METNHLFIVNLKAGGKGEPLKNVEIIHQFMKKSNLSYQVFYTDYPGHAVKIVRENTPCEYFWKIFACGGDGTLQEVLNGSQGKENVAIAHVACGTGNDFVRHFGNKDLFNIENLINGRIIEVDYIQSNLGIAMNCISTGFDAAVASQMHKFRKFSRLGSKVPYNLGIITALSKGLSKHYSVTIDDKTFDGKYTVALAMNGSYYGGGFRPIPESDVCDGFLDIMLIKAVSIVKFAKNLELYTKGGHKQIKFCEHHRCKNFSFRSDTVSYYNLDGEITSQNMVSGNISDTKTKFIIPNCIIAEHSVVNA